MIPLIATLLLCPCSHNVYERDGDSMRWIGCTNDTANASGMWYPTHWKPSDVLGREMK